MGLTELNLEWPRYRLFPYERELALRETKAVLRPHGEIAVNGTVQLRTLHPQFASRLTYFKTASTGSDAIDTIQERLERGVGAETDARRRQSTRYSVHGLHEYKGKFNPQIVKAVLNSLGIQRGHILDPFCGSGTTLVECAHAGGTAVGCDVNPLAVFIANAKLSALAVPASRVHDAARRVVRAASAQRFQAHEGDPGRAEYLRTWFPTDNLRTLELLRAAIELEDVAVQSVLKVIASDLLRDYSWQEPMDLRIRRRKSDLPDTPLQNEFSRAAEKFCASIGAAQKVLGNVETPSRALLVSSADVTTRQLGSRKQFDGAITSPPYATALPYIDTQRLSIVWLGLAAPKDLPRLQAQLIGSREFHGKNDRTWDERLTHNTNELPKPMHDLCLTLRSSLTPDDGFRRRAVPRLLYRYMVGMRDMFRSVSPLLKAAAPFILIVGHNHTTLGGKRFDIDTPEMLGQLAASAGYKMDERVELQTYQRYGLHQKNAVAKEELLILRRG